MTVKAIARRGGTTAQHSTFVGLGREITVDTDKHTLVVHDGATAGGFPLAKAADVVSSVSPTFTGVPTAPTAPAGTNTTQLATTAFVRALGDGKMPSTGIATAVTFGEVTVTGNSHIGGSSPLAGARLYIKGETVDASKYGIYVTDSAGTERFTQKNNGDTSIGGNVLINTPTVLGDGTAKLQVNGSGYFAGGITASSLILGTKTGTYGNVFTSYNGSTFLGIPTGKSFQITTEAGAALLDISSTGLAVTGGITATNGATSGSCGQFTTAGAGDAAVIGCNISAGGMIYAGFNSNKTLITFKVIENGNVQNTNNSYGAISDITLKENITTSRSYLDDLCKVNIVKFSFKSDKSDKANQLGVIAQEVEKIFPAMIDIDTKGIKGVKYSIFVPMLITAIQELNAKVKALEK